MAHIYSDGFEYTNVKHNCSTVRSMIDQQKKTAQLGFYFERENIYTIRKKDIIKEPIISDSDFFALMKILGTANYNFKSAILITTPPLSLE